MRLRRRHILGPLKALSAPLLATAVVTVGAGLHASSSYDIPTRSEQVELAATIDTASNAAGISDSSLYFMSQSDLDTAMQEMQTMGVTQIRVLLPWQSMEPTDGTYSWSQADQLLSTAAKYGMAVEATITSTPTWATNYSAGGVIANGQPNSVTDYASFVQALASRYGSSNNAATGLLSAIEVWNEPNGFTGWYPTPTAQGYTDLLKAAYAAIKSAAPGITVVAGALGAGVTMGSLTVNPVTFLQQMYADGAAGFFDALSFHPYNYTGTFSGGTTYANSAIKQLQALQALMAANGDAAKLIWATEYGEPSSESGGQAQQAAYIQDFLNTWSSLTGVGPMFLYSLLPDGQGDNLNIFNADWTAKAAVAVIEAWIAAHPTGTPATSIPGTIVSTIGTLLQNVAAAVKALVSNIATAVSNLAASISNAVANLLKALTGANKAVAAVAATITPKAAAASTSTTEDVVNASVAAASMEQTAAVTVSSTSTKAGKSGADSNAAADDNAAAADQTSTGDKATTAGTTTSSDDTSSTTPVVAATSDTGSTATTVSGSTDGTTASAGTTTGSTTAASGSTTAASPGTATSVAATSTSSGSSTTGASASGSATSGAATSGAATSGSATSGSATDNSSTSSSSDKATKKSKKDKKPKAGSRPTSKSGDSGPKSAGSSGSSSNSHKNSHKNSQGQSSSSNQPKHHAHD